MLRESRIAVGILYRVTVPLVVIFPMSSVVVNQRLPSGPAVIADATVHVRKRILDHRAGARRGLTRPGSASVSDEVGVGVGVGNALATVKSTRSYVTPAVSCKLALGAVKAMVVAAHRSRAFEPRPAGLRDLPSDRRARRS